MPAAEDRCGHAPTRCRGPQSWEISQPALGGVDVPKSGRGLLDIKGPLA